MNNQDVNVAAGLNMVVRFWRLPNRRVRAHYIIARITRARREEA